MAGILNVTPDSFSDGGKLAAPAQVVAHAQKLVAEGAHLLDLGAESTRPGFVPISRQEEWSRLEPALLALRRALPHVPLSVDTRHAATAAKALALGVRVINDVSALGDPAMAATVARYEAVVVLMHGFVAPGGANLAAAQVTPAEVLRFLARARDRAVAGGVDPGKIWLDPGLGFGKDPRQNFALTATLSDLRSLGCPLYFAPSRKRFLGVAAGKAAAEDRDVATAACCAIAVSRGADLVRVHAPAAVRDAIAVGSAVYLAAQPWPNEQDPRGATKA